MLVGGNANLDLRTPCASSVLYLDHVVSQDEPCLYVF